MEPNDNAILDIIFSFSNPAIYAIIFTIVLVITILRIKREFISPLQRRIKKLEEENEKLRGKFMEELKEL